MRGRSLAGVIGDCKFLALILLLTCVASLSEAAEKPGVNTEEKMDSGEKSLRLLVEKWLALTAATAVGVAEFGRMRSKARERYVRIEASRAAGLLTIFFFRHDDGSWYVFPTVTDRHLP